MTKELFNIYDVIIFEDENGITQDCVCTIGKNKEADEMVDVIECNKHSISIYENGSYKVWEKDGKDTPYYVTTKKIIHLYTLKNDNRYYEIYPTDDYGVDSVNSSEALKCLELLGDFEWHKKSFKEAFPDLINTIKNYILETQEQEKFLADKLVFKNGCLMSGFDYKGKQIVAMPLEEFDEFMKQEEALEITNEKCVGNDNLLLVKESLNYKHYLEKAKLGIDSVVNINLKEKDLLTEEEFNVLKGMTREWKNIW